jgi:hypothetical protein
MRYLTIAMSAVLLAGSAAAPQRPETWRQAYKDNIFAPRAIADFDEARSRMEAEMDRLVESCELSPAGARRLSRKLEDLEYEYIIKWYGGPDDQAVSRSQNVNAGFDANYRDPVSNRDIGPAPPKSAQQDSSRRK